MDNRALKAHLSDDKMWCNLILEPATSALNAPRPSVFLPPHPICFIEVTRVALTHFDHESGNRVLQLLRPFQMPLVLTEE